MASTIQEDLKQIITASPASSTKAAQLLVDSFSVNFDSKKQKSNDSLLFSCESQYSDKDYIISFGYDNNKLKTICSCPVFETQNAICKHIKATALFIQKSPIINDKLKNLKEPKIENPNETLLKYIPANALSHDLLPSSDKIKAGIHTYDDFDILNNQSSYFSVTNALQNNAEIIFVRQSSTFKIKLERITNSNALVLCNCKQKKPCIHQATVLDTIRKYDFDFLKQLEDTEKYKIEFFKVNNITKSLQNLFTLNFHLSGKSTYSSKNENAKNINKLLNVKTIVNKQKEVIFLKNQTTVASNVNDSIFYILRYNSYENLYYFKPYVGKLKKNGELSKKIQEFSDVTDFAVIKDSDEQIALAKEIHKRLKKDNLLSSSYYKNDNTGLILEPHFTVDLHWSKIAAFNNTYAFQDLYENNLAPIKLCPNIVDVEVDLIEVDKSVVLKPAFSLDINGSKVKLDFKKNNQVGTNLFLHQGLYYRITTESAVLLLGLWDSKGNHTMIDDNVFEEIKQNLFINILDKHVINFESEKYKPQILKLNLSGKKVYLKEDKDYFIILPAFMYEHQGQLFESEMNHSKMVTLEDENSNLLIERDLEVEQEIENGLRALHPDFEEQIDFPYFYLPHEKILEDNWFFGAFDYLKTAGFEILGLKELKKLKYSPHKASINVSAGSGIDWFDLKIEMSFGSEKIAVAQLKKALQNNQKYVTLSNGTLGMLPDEWIAKYERIIKGGKLKKDGIEFNQIQYGLIDHLYEEIGNNQSLLAFHEKRQKLLSFQNIDKKKIPSNVHATLRDYQQGGYQWLHFLDEFGWGGCLADDMGLGKTLQMLAFIQSKVNENPAIKILVVVPASLIFNWQREAEKFCPELKLLNQTGVAREKEFEIFKKFNVILTTYALLRIDIDTLKDVAFDYVILDESQAIKNPMSQTAKASKILNTKNRLIMTGTPIENNTFDLYSQFDFLNPGLLGSIENFRETYATPIDRDRNEQAAESLRRLIYPFILSRKKDQVAKDLPPKTETVIYCEMSKNQRKIYNKVRDQIKEDLEGLIQKEGINKSNIAILQGMLKLRQVCNSPALLSNDENTVHDSIKLDTLMENVMPVIAENHKVLIFSFFVEMLELIKERFKKEHIQYAWITGQTSQREAQVQQFQQDENCKVFLISLKAGGVGLNLTAADYVYLVDPWWNPAVEQQAIDRAHRIGQKQSVFAYKMICKDTIEEKILQLQEKKKSVADDLVNIESGTIKKLSKDDVMALFD